MFFKLPKNLFANKDAVIANQNNLSLEVESLEPRMMLSAVQVFASGSTGQEQFDVQIKGETVQSYSVGTEVSEFTFHTDPNVTADDIRIVFTNDAYDEATGLDRNLIVDKIAVHGQTFETEADSTFSTGTWTPSNGFVDGYHQSETLHGNGYFQYSGGSSASTSTLTVFASGDEGGETFDVLVNGTTVGSFSASTYTQAYSVDVAAGTTASQVRVEFTNDAYDASIGLDRNLNVDRISIDGVSYQTEASSTFSTGTWTSNDGIVAGFGRGETLHGNGYFQFGAGSNSGSTVQIHAQGQEGGEQFTVLVNGQVVDAFEVGTSPQVFTLNVSDSDVNNVEIIFTNDENNAHTGADKNLTIDKIVVNGQTTQTESPGVFSTGTWTSSDGLVEGFGRGDTLHSDGKFVFTFDGNNPTPDTVLVVRDDYYSTSFNQNVSGNVLSNDFDLDGDNFHVFSSTSPSNGSVVVNQDGTFTYTPNSGFTGTDTFTYVACDIDGNFREATVTVNVGAPANTNPNANDDSESTVEETPVTISVLGNDSDPQSNDLTIVGTSTPSNGNVSIVNGTLVYTPNDGFTGTDTFTYTITDGLGGYDTANVSVTVDGAQNSSISGTVWKDWSVDGIFTANEDALANVKVELRNARGWIIAETTTDGDGNYSFNQLAPGEYSVSVVAASGMRIGSKQNAGSNDSVDSDVNSATGRSDTIWLGVNTHQDVDAAIEDNPHQSGTFQYGFANNNRTIVAGLRVKANRMPDDFKQFVGADSSQMIEYFTDLGWTPLDIGVHGSGPGNNEQLNTHWQGANTLDYRIYMDEPTWGAIGQVDKTRPFEYEITYLTTGNQVKTIVCKFSSAGITYGSPIALDLNGDGEIGVTGDTSSQDKDPNAAIGETVQFDIDADGTLDTIEWFTGDGDGILVDVSKIGTDGSIDGSALFGDQGGMYTDGYSKLGELDSNGDGQISGNESVLLGVWLDDGDAILEEGELQGLQEVGVTSISVGYQFDSEGRMQSTATMADGTSILTEDVWFVQAG